LAEEYRVRVEMKGGPFAIDSSDPSVIKVPQSERLEGKVGKN
jgi:hypothetical protein